MFLQLILCCVALPVLALTDPEIDDVVDNMSSIGEKVGQLLIVGFNGKQGDCPPTLGDIKELITQRFVGAVILYSRNIDSPQQVAHLTNELQQLTQQTPTQIPVWKMSPATAL